ncbi:MAG: 30S ribosomal protein S8 [Candidatus Nanoarchaeia archaeon]|nr:30S ribosomal protein S8 [Candidatus Nanoarchaeia archaeon]
MALNDTLSNVLSMILNAEKKGKFVCIVEPASKTIKSVLNIMNQRGYLGSIKVMDNSKGGQIEVNLSGNINKCGVIKPRFAVKATDFEKFEKRFLPAKNFGILIISTSKGIMTHMEAREKNLGGKLVAYCY